MRPTWPGSLLPMTSWRGSTPTHCLTAAAMDANFVEAAEQSSQGSAGRNSAPRGGGGSPAFDIATCCPV